MRTVLARHRQDARRNEVRERGGVEGRRWYSERAEVRPIADPERMVDRPRWPEVGDDLVQPHRLQAVEVRLKDLFVALFRRPVTVGNNEDDQGGPLQAITTKSAFMHHNHDGSQLGPPGSEWSRSSRNQKWLTAGEPAASSHKPPVESSTTGTAGLQLLLRQRKSGPALVPIPSWN
jgi:hypothetical protein